MNTHDIDIDLPEHDCIYETTNESGFIDVEPAYRKSTVLRLIEADRKTTERQLAAYKRLVNSLESRLTDIQAQHDELKKSTNPELLASERAANAILTEELEADRKRRGEPVAENIERLAINRYRPVPAGLLAYKVVAGDGSRSLFSGTKDECKIMAAKLTEAFLDGAHVASQPAEPVNVPSEDGGET